MEPSLGIGVDDVRASGALEERTSPQVLAARAADLALAAAALRGERAALEGLVQRLGCVPRILAANNQRIGSPLRGEELADLVQEVLSKVWGKLPRFRGEAVLETWIYPFCALELLSAVRKKRSAPRLEREPAEEPTSVEEPAFGPSDFECLYRGLEKLPEAQASCIRLRWFQGASFEDIGARLAVPVNTAKTHYYRGMERLRALLAPRLGGGP